MEALPSRMSANDELLLLNTAVISISQFHCDCADFQCVFTSLLLHSHLNSIAGIHGFSLARSQVFLLPLLKLLLLPVVS